jgi:ABC-type cobalamin transport system ATPase subunit
MIKRVKLDSLEVRNYLGAGDQYPRLQLDGNHSVLCGPNGSGKTTLLSALDHLKRVNWKAALQSWSQGHNPSQVTLWEWFDVRPYFTAQPRSRRSARSHSPGASRTSGVTANAARRGRRISRGR